MKSPVGMEENDPGSSPEDCYQLLKGIYGLCQAARQFWKKFVNTVKQEPFGFQVSPADPCDRIPSTTPGAEPPIDARDSGSARSHSMHLETSSSDRP